MPRVISELRAETSNVCLLPLFAHRISGPELQCFQLERLLAAFASPTPCALSGQVSRRPAKTGHYQIKDASILCTASGRGGACLVWCGSPTAELAGTAAELAGTAAPAAYPPASCTPAGQVDAPRDVHAFRLQGGGQRCFVAYSQVAVQSQGKRQAPTVVGGEQRV